MGPLPPEGKKNKFYVQLVEIPWKKDIVKERKSTDLTEEGRPDCVQPKMILITTVLEWDVHSSSLLYDGPFDKDTFVDLVRPDTSKDRRYTSVGAHLTLKWNGPTSYTMSGRALTLLIVKVKEISFAHESNVSHFPARSLEDLGL